MKYMSRYIVLNKLQKKRPTNLYSHSICRKSSTIRPFLLYESCFGRQIEMTAHQKNSEYNKISMMRVKKGGEYPMV